MNYYWIFTIIFAIVGGVSIFFADYKSRYLISDFLGEKIEKTFTRLDKVGSVWLVSVLLLYSLGSFIIALSFFIQHADTGPEIVIFSFIGIFLIIILVYNVRKGNFKIHDKK